MPIGDGGYIALTHRCTSLTKITENPFFHVATKQTSKASFHLPVTPISKSRPGQMFLHLGKRKDSKRESSPSWNIITKMKEKLISTTTWMDLHSICWVAKGQS